MKPPADLEALIDIQFRNGTTRRATQGKKWRWGLWSGPHKHLGETDYDIVRWQPAQPDKADDKGSTWTAVSGGYA